MHDGVGDRYPQLLRTSRYRWWRPLLGLVLAAAIVFAGAIVVVVVIGAVSALAGVDQDVQESLGADSPWGLLANNLLIALVLPAVLLAVFVVHREPAGTLSSVSGRLRRQLLLRLLPLGFAVVLVFFAVSFAVPPAGVGDIDVPGASTLVGLLVVIVLTTPLQAAAEEYGFRGYLTQAVASWFPRPLVGTVLAAVVSALLFALAHGGQEPALFLDRFAFGLVASWLVWRTGGLEASLVLHVANNMVSLSWTAATGSIEEALSVSSLDWPYAVLDVLMMLVFAWLADRLARRLGTAVRREPSGAPGGVLSATNEVGYRGQRSEGSLRRDDDRPWGMG